MPVFLKCIIFNNHKGEKVSFFEKQNVTQLVDLVSLFIFESPDMFVFRSTRHQGDKKHKNIYIKK
jgi:hypothetical protein